MASSLALLSLKSTTTRTLFTKFLRPSFSSLTTTRSTTAARSLFSRGNNWDDDPVLTENGAYSVNPLQFSGPRKLVVIGTPQQNKEHKIVRVVLPGVGEGEYKAWINPENNAVCVEGEGKTESDGEDGRKYEGSVNFDSEDVKVEKIVGTDIKNGILKITLAKNIGRRQSLFTFGGSTDQKPRRTIPNVALDIKGVPMSQIVHPFQIAGPEEVKVVRIGKIGQQFVIRLRLVMPGVGEDGLKVRLEDNTVIFIGHGEIEDESESFGRNYGGSYPVDFEVKELHSDLANGILSIEIMGEPRKF